MATKLSIEQVNNLDRNDFVEKFENIVECYKQTALFCLEKRPFKSTEQFLDTVQTFLRQLSLQEKENILKLHPDLAGRLADEGKLTSESTNEQKSAGLDNLTANEKMLLNELNQRYKSKFSFPFVICARENKYNAIINGLNIRLNYSRDQEISNGIEEVVKISKLRILEIINKE